jgi:hypothetical protein
MKTIQGSDEFLAEMEASFGPAQEFQPTVTYIRDGDCIEFFARPGSYYAERLDDLVTVYLSRQNGEIVGSVIKGVSTFCKKMLERYPGFKIEVADGRIRLEHLLRAHLWSESAETNSVRVHTYRKLIEVAEETNAEAELVSV